MPQEMCFTSKSWVLFKHLSLVNRRFSGHVTYQIKIYQYHTTGFRLSVSELGAVQTFAAGAPQILWTFHLPDKNKSELYHWCHT